MDSRESAFGAADQPLLPCGLTALWLLQTLLPFVLASALHRAKAYVVVKDMAWVSFVRLPEI